MAQWIARWTSDPEVVGSSPTVIEFFFLSSFYGPYSFKEETQQIDSLNDNC